MSRRKEMKLKKWLEVNDMTQKELAKKLDVDHTTVCKYVNGTRTPHIKIIRKISKLTAYVVTIDDFIQ